MEFSGKRNRKRGYDRDEREVKTRNTKVEKEIRILMARREQKGRNKSG